jgi:hypothetical protein
LNRSHCHTSGSYPANVLVQICKYVDTSDKPLQLSRLYTQRTHASGRKVTWQCYDTGQHRVHVSAHNSQHDEIISAVN